MRRKAQLLTPPHENAFDVQWWPIVKPQDYPKNARKWTPAAIRKVAESIRQFGWQQPVVVDRHDVIIIGHLRRAAGQSIGEERCPVKVAEHLTPAQVRQLRLMDNRSHEEAAWDLDILTAEMLELKALDLDLSLTGFSSGELDRMTRVASAGEDDAPALPESPVTRLGDLWILGKHRVLCGDALADYRRLGAAFGAIVTDPPYGISADSMTLGTGKRRFHRSGFDATRPDIHWLLGLARQVCIWGGNYFADVLPVSADWLCWHKKNDGLSFAEVELAWTNFGKNARMCSHHWSGEQKLHPTMKPVHVMRWVLGFIDSGGPVLDPYAGSGSTLIAAEGTGHICCAVELEPAYVDVIVTRWQNLTGQEATLDGHGATFAHVKHGRQQQAEDALKEEAFASR